MQFFTTRKRFALAFIILIGVWRWCWGCRLWFSLLNNWRYALAFRRFTNNRRHCDLTARFEYSRCSSINLRLGFGFLHFAQLGRSRLLSFWLDALLLDRLFLNRRFFDSLRLNYWFYLLFNNWLCCSSRLLRFSLGQLSRRLRFSLSFCCFSFKALSLFFSFLSGLSGNTFLFSLSFCINLALRLNFLTLRFFLL